MCVCVRVAVANTTDQQKMLLLQVDADTTELLQKLIRGVTGSELSCHIRRVTRVVHSQKQII